MNLAVIYSGMDGTVRRRFTNLAALQAYVRDRWQGADYIGGLGGGDFHTDYGQYTLVGCKLSDLGRRRSSNPNDDAYWDWDWTVLPKQ